MKPDSTSLSIEQIMKEMTVTVMISTIINKRLKVKLWFAKYLFILGAKVMGCGKCEFISKGSP